MKLVKKLLSAVLSVSMVFSLMPVAAMAETANDTQGYEVLLSSSADSVKSGETFTVDVAIKANGNEAPPLAAQVKMSVENADFVSAKSDVKNGKTTYKNGSAAASYYSDADGSANIFDENGNFIIAQYTFKSKEAGKKAVISAVSAEGSVSDGISEAKFVISAENGKVSVDTVNGDIGDIVYIGTAEQLKAFMQDVNDGNPYEGKTVQLTDDIMLSGDWTPIGTENYPFSGIFDGNGHEINGLQTDDTISTAVYGSYHGYGLFGHVENAVIKNIKQVEGSIKFTLDDTPYAFFAVGGIVGYATGTCDIKNCTSKVDILVKCNGRYTMIGGIAGWLGYKAEFEKINISDCKNYGLLEADNPEGTNYYMGGIIGMFGNAFALSTLGGASWHKYIQSSDITVERCGNYADIYKVTEPSWRPGDVYDESDEGSWKYVMYGYTGGIMGMTTSCGDVLINECVNKGDITGWHRFIGGILGGIYRGTVKNCYNIGNMRADADNDWSGGWEATIAGLIGVTYEKVGYDPVAGDGGTGPFGSFSIINDYNGGSIDGSKFVELAGSTYDLYGKLKQRHEIRWTASPDSPDEQTNCYSYKNVTAGEVTAEKMGSSFKEDVNNIQAGLPLLHWEENSVLAGKYDVTFECKNVSGESVAGASVKVYAKADMSDDSEVLGADGKFDLTDGNYYYKASANGYLESIGNFKVNGKDKSVEVTMIKEAIVTFTVKPSDASFTLKNSNGEVVEAISVNNGIYKYLLEDEARYSYTASASGYNGTTRDFTATAGNVNIELTKSSYNPGSEDKMVYGSKNTGKIHTITSKGTYYIGSGAEGVLTVDTTDEVILIGKGISENDVYENLCIDCVNAGSDVTIQDVYLKYELKDNNQIKFVGRGNTLKFKGTNILEKNTGASGYAMIYVPYGTELTISGGSSDYLYIYKREQGAGIGGNGSAKNGEGIESQYNGDITIDGGNYFMKNSKQGALIGAGSGAAGVSGSPGSITISNADMYLIAYSRGAAIGGSAGTQASGGSDDVTIDNSTITINVDFSGSAIGGGGYDGGNDSGGGTVIYESGSVKTYIDKNALSNWGVSKPGVNGNKAITAEVTNKSGETLYLCMIDTSKINSSKSYFTVKSDKDGEIYSGGLHKYEFVGANDSKYTTNIESTLDNWVASDDTNIYVYVTGDDHEFDVNGQIVQAKWDSAKKTFTLTYPDGTTAVGGSGGGSLAGDNTPLVSETIKPDTNVSGSAASSSVKKNDVEDAVKAVGESSNSEIIIDASSGKDNITKSEVTIPADSVKTVAKDTNADIVIKTDVGDVKISNSDISDIIGTGSDIKITIEKNKDGSIAVSVKSGSNEIKTEGAVFTVSCKVDENLMKSLADNAGQGNSNLVAAVVENGKTGDIIKNSFVAEDGTVYVMIPAGTTFTVIANGKSFKDVASGAWYSNAVAFAVSHGLFDGVSEDLFAPDKSMTRGMFVTVLNRLAAAESYSGKSEFTDVPADMWYAVGTAWAASKDIVNGYGDGTFGPDNEVTREQMAVIMYNFTKAMGYDVTGNASLDKFSDSALVSSWATEAMQWAVGAGVMNGNTDGTLNPKGTATRAQVATIMMNYVKILLDVG